MSPPSQPSSTERAGKEHHLEDNTQTSSTDTCSHPQSPSKCMSETEDQSSFVVPSGTSTPNKIGSMPCFHSISTNSRHSMTPLDTLLSGSFMGHSSINPVTSVAGSQWVTSSMWQPPRPFCKRLFPQIMQTSFYQFPHCFASGVCSVLWGNGCERLCASRPLLGSYVHQESI